MFNDLIQRALALHQGGRLAEAEPVYRQLLAGGADDFQIHFMYAVLLYQQQRFGDALGAVAKALQRDPQSMDALGLQAALQQTTGRAAEAFDTLSRIVDRAPGHGDAWYNRGVVLIDLERWEEAVASFDRALAIQPTPMAWTNRASALQRLGRLQESLDSADRALAIARDYPLALHNRGVALRALGRIEEALGAFDAVLAAAPQTTEAWIERAAALYEARRFEEALASSERAAALNPQSVRAWIGKAAALKSLRRHGEALEAYDRVRLLAPQTALDDDRALCLFKLRRFDAALAAYDAALARTPDSVDLWHDRAVVLTAMQRFDEALASIDQALRRDPESPHALLAKGKLLCELNRVGEGLALLSARAQAVHGGPIPADAAPQPHKQRHDAEQAEYMAARGLPTGRFHIESGQRIAGQAVNPANREAVAKTWAESEPKIVVIDNLLTPDGLEALRRFALGSTVWRKPYAQGYLGAFTESGFACPLLAQIADELREVFPTVIEDHGLVNTWGFKYDSTLGGIRIHADQAAVNVNFWITPDEGNLNPQSGGMVIWDAAAPPDWEIERYNGDDDAVRAFLAEAKSKAITVPYRANRAVIFDSDLFHETDRIEFAEGYLNRRVNVTMLYGRRTFSNN